MQGEQSIQNMQTKDIMSRTSTLEQINNRAQKDVLHKDTLHIIKPELIQSEAEDDLYRYVLEMSSKKMVSADAFYEMIVGFVPVIDKFFEDVMVMDENILVRNNRLRILAEADKEFMKIANFTKIVK